MMASTPHVLDHRDRAGQGKPDDVVLLYGARRASDKPLRSDAGSGAWASMRGCNRGTGCLQKPCAHFLRHEGELS